MSFCGVPGLAVPGAFTPGLPFTAGSARFAVRAGRVVITYGAPAANITTPPSLMEAIPGRAVPGMFVPGRPTATGNLVTSGLGFVSVTITQPS